MSAQQEKIAAICADVRVINRYIVPMEQTEWTDCYEYGYIAAARIPMNARNRKAVLRTYRTRRIAIKALMEACYIEPHGCRCSQCMAGHDCCGRMFVYATHILPTRKGILIRQFKARNV